MNRNQKMMLKFGRVINKFTMIEKSPRDFGTGDLLYSSEIHTIEAIGLNPGANVTDLAAALGISKAAVSQIVKKLERKNLVRRYKAKGNEKDVLADLSPKGRAAFRGHSDFHARMDKGLISRIKRMSSSEYDFLYSLLGDIEGYTDEILEERR